MKKRRSYEWSLPLLTLLPVKLTSQQILQAMWTASTQWGRCWQHVHQWHVWEGNDTLHSWKWKASPYKEDLWVLVFSLLLDGSTDKANIDNELMNDIWVFFVFFCVTGHMSFVQSFLVMLGHSSTHAKKIILTSAPAVNFTSCKVETFPSCFQLPTCAPWTSVSVWTPVSQTWPSVTLLTLVSTSPWRRQCHPHILRYYVLQGLLEDKLVVRYLPTQ